jgi:flagellar hook-associated protein 3 FlgL
MSMRITQSMMSDTLLGNISSLQSRISDTSTELETGKRINQPSDDPLGTQRALQLSNQSNAIDQYTSNAADASGFLQTTDTALQSITSLTQRVRDLAVTGANGTNNQTDMNALASEVDSLIDGVKSAAGATNNGTYVMSGTQTTTAPYAQGASDTYQGDTGTIARAIGPGVSVQVNTLGSDVLGNGIVAGTSDGKLLGTLRTISADLKAGNQSAVSADLKTLDGNMDTISSADATVGATMNRVTAATTSLAASKVQTQALLSSTQNADLAQVTVTLANEQSVYEAALQSGASVIQKSLLDFLTT